MTLRHIWLPDFDVIPVEEVGSLWPTAYIVERWERNMIGERRFTGESRTYTEAAIPDRDALARALRRVTEDYPGLLAAADMENEPMALNVAPAADAILAALREQP